MSSAFVERRVLTAQVYVPYPEFSILGSEVGQNMPFAPQLALS
jgi:hypothetical protein